MKKWLRRIGLTLVVGLIAAVAAGSAYEWLGRRSARRDHPPRGTLVDVGGRRLQLDCRGQGTPTVVLESGLDIFGSLAWGLVHDSLAATTRTCAYSRAGVMWSDARRDPFSASGVADDLHTALQVAGEQGPLVLAGHSLGGPLVLVYTGRYPDQTAGLVLVDASHPDQLERTKAFLPGGGMPSLTPFKVGAALAWTGVIRLATSGTPGQTGQSEQDRLAAVSYTSASLGGALRELEGLAPALAEAGKFRQLGDRPLVVLTSMKPFTAAELETAGMTTAQGIGMKRAWAELQAEQATWSTRSRHQVLDDASHYIQFDRPDVVIRAMREVVEQVRMDVAGRGAPK